MIIGTSGSRNGMNKISKNILINELNKINSITAFHHGDCKGVDEEFHNIIRDHDKSINIIVHPPINNSLRSYCNGNIIKKENTYLQRNKNIVNQVNLMIFLPSTNQEILRSGTWSTIRYCKKINKKYIIIFPDGSIEYSK